ncbi:MAG TPA: hypothetical protein VKL40_05540 [Candidatus Angelobacter sp.]|nr:hypothetical protein [Candidatus Angelobacter sp.]
MKPLIPKVFLVIVALAAGIPAWAQGCVTRDEIPAASRTAIESAAQQVFDQASRGDANALRQNAIPSLQSNFGGIAGAVNDNKPALTGAKTQLRIEFLLDTGATPPADGLFFCGVFGAGGMSSGSAQFEIPGLPAGKYAVVIQDFIGSKGPYALTTIFQEASGGWKLAGFYVRPESAGGHDGLWYLERAREYKAKSQNHNAWFYYLTSWDLMAPVTFMDTALLSKISQESNSALPKDVPVGGKPVSYSANGKTYNITDMSVFRTENSFDLSIKYSVASAADFNATLADAQSLARAFAAQYPELKDAFNNVWAHAIDPNGADVTGLVNLKPAAKP